MIAIISLCFLLAVIWWLCGVACFLKFMLGLSGKIVVCDIVLSVFVGILDPAALIFLLIAWVASLDTVVWSKK